MNTTEQITTTAAIDGNAMLAAVPSDMKLIYEAMVSRFLRRVAEADADTYKSDYYWKWVGTSQLADELGYKCSQLRQTLNKMEKLGLVHSQRRPNWVCWAANHIAGFKQHQFKDYYCRSA
jgi:hypothetical protein